MQEEENQPPFYIRHLILRIPYYILVAIYVITLHPILKLFARIYGILQRGILHVQVKLITNKAFEAFKQEQHAKAILLFLQCIEKIPFVYRPLYSEYKLSVLSLGPLYRITGNLRKAEEYLDEAYSIIGEDDLDSINLFIYIGDFYADKGRFKAAENHYLTIYQWLSEHKEWTIYKTLCFNLHTLYLQMGQIEKAEKFLNESEE